MHHPDSSEGLLASLPVPGEALAEQSRLCTFWAVLISDAAMICLLMRILQLQLDALLQLEIAPAMTAHASNPENWADGLDCFCIQSLQLHTRAEPDGTISLVAL